jgi:aspartate racemase
MGPRSTAPFVDMVIDECERQYAPRGMGDFPHIIVYSLPAPFRLEAMDHEAVQSAIIAGLQRLESFGVDFIAMPCNTAHLYFSRLRDSVSVPLLDMIQIAVDAMPVTRRPALLATRLTAEASLYQDSIRARGDDVMWSEELQREVDATIQSVQRGAKRNEVHERLARVLEQVGASYALVACSDISLGTAVEHIDASRALAAATVSRYLSLAVRNS